MDLLTPIGAGLIAYASKDMIAKLLGPTFEYIGEGLKSFVEKRNNNVISIFARANKKLGTKLNQDGIVNPRVLKHILDDGSFCEDRLTQDYYAGLLASSRTTATEGTSGYDETLPYLSIIEQMSAKNILFHYILYMSFTKCIFAEEGINFFDENNINKRLVCFPIPTVNQIFGEGDITVNISDICSYALKEKLIHQYNSGPLKERESHLTIESALLRVNPSLHGLNLFLKANAAPNNILSATKEVKVAWIDTIENQTDIEILPTLL